MAACISVKFSRLQFTPDMLPADVIGTQIYNPQSGGFTTRKGPVFANLVLADEINRAPAKVQSALLEAMQEKQVTIGDQTFKLEEPFLVLATQNPSSRKARIRCPAQVDRLCSNWRSATVARRGAADLSNGKNFREPTQRGCHAGANPQGARSHQ
jgi:MoxR-like ATPase